MPGRINLFIVVFLLNVTHTSARDIVSIFSVQNADTTAPYEQLNCGPVVTLASVDCEQWEHYLEENFGAGVISKEWPCNFQLVTVYFVVDRTGAIAEVIVKDPVLPELAQKIIRILQRNPFKWKPATQNGRVVRSYHQLVLKIPKEMLND